MKTYTNQGTPTQTLSRASEISPHLKALIAEMRQDDGKLNRHLKLIWVVGLLFAAFAYSQDQMLSCIFTALCTVVLVVGAKVAVTAMTRPRETQAALSTFEQNPTAANAANVARVYQAFGDNGSRVAYLSRAVQWSAVWCELSGNDTRSLIHLAKSSCSHAYAIGVRLKQHPRFTNPHVIQQLLVIANDAIDKARESTTDSALLADIVRVEGYYDTCKRLEQRLGIR